MYCKRGFAILYFVISVVIPAYNEEKRIGPCLQALVNQNTTHKFEVIVVDNNCTDDTVKIASTFSDKLDLKIIKEETKGRGAARKIGFEKATGDVIFSTDSDTIVPPNWIEDFMKALKSKNVIAVSGNCKIDDCGRRSNTVFNLLQPVFMRSYRIFLGYYWLSGFSFAIYKDAYEKSGGFNDLLTAQEDVDLSFRVKKVGKIKYASKTPVIFSGRRFKNGLVRGLMQYPITYTESFVLKRKHVNLPDVR